MAKQWMFWQKKRWDNYGNWSAYNEEEPDYRWLKQIVVATIIFVISYLAHISNTQIGQSMDEGIQYMLTREIDVQKIVDRMNYYTDNKLDLSVLKNVQTKITRPADPLLYMTKPTEGKVVSTFGWYNDKNSGQEFLREGINFETQAGENVKAAAPGKVKIVTDSVQYGKTLIIEHGQSVETVYGKLGEILVSRNEMVSQGQVIARVAGNSKTGTMLYFEIREKSVAIDPSIRIKNLLTDSERK